MNEIPDDAWPTPPEAMRANPGGTLPPDQILGRRDLARLCWRVLEVQSLRLENERRLGKTLLTRLMASTAPAGTRCVMMEVGGLASAAEFVEEVLDKVDRTFPEKSKRLSSRFHALVERYLPGADILGLRLPESLRSSWRRLLVDSLEMVAEVAEARVVFFWDEMPWMLQKIQEREGREAMIDLLDTLRDIRETNQNVRMVFTGSIGFHHILDELEQDGVPSRPLNNMRRIEVGPLTGENAHDLALRLLRGEEVSCEDPEAVAAEMASQTGGVAFYIHHIVTRLAESGGTAAPDRVRTIVQETLTQPSDPWEMRHFERRLGAYYGNQAASARLLLDGIAQMDGASDLSAVEEMAANGAPELDRHELLDLLRKLMLDHYLVETPEGYTFKFPLLERWWFLYRKLDQ